MHAAPALITPAPTPRRRIWPRFSLLTLLCFVLLAGSGMWLWTGWLPWTLERELKGHPGAIFDATFSHDGRRAATSGADGDGTVRIWDITTGACVATIPASVDRRAIYRSVFSSDDQSILTVCWYDNTITLWRIDTGHVVFSLPDLSSTYSAAISPDGTRLISACATSQLWDARDGHKIDGISFDAEYIWSHVNFSPNGTRIVAIRAGDNTAYLFDAQTGAKLKQVGDRGNIYRASFSSDGTKIVTSQDSLRVRKWDARTGNEIAALGTNDGVNNLVGVFSPDGVHMSTSTDKGGLRIWNAESGALLCEWRFSDSAAYCIAYSPDGSRIIASGDDRIARIYRRNHPEEWWGVVCLLAFWMTLFFAIAFLSSAIRDKGIFGNSGSRQPITLENITKL